MRVFISHAPEDAGIAKRIYDDLEQTPGIEPWMADIDLLPGQDRKREINRAIRGSRFFIPILSSRSVSQSGYMQKEMRLALEELDEMPEGDIFVIPVRVDACEPSHDRLADLRPADLFPSYADGVAQIRRSLGVNVDSAPFEKTPDPSVFEPATKGTIPVNSEADKARQLAEALINCPAMRNRRSRGQIVNCLHTDVSRKIEVEGSPDVVVREMVDLCKDHPGGIDRLMECVGDHERGSIPFAEARRVREAAFGASEAEAIAPVPKPDPVPRRPDAPIVDSDSPPSAKEPASEPPARSKSQEPPLVAEKSETPEPDTKKTESENATWEKVTAVAFGVVFVSVMLVIAVWIPDPTPFQEMMFRVVLALAAAGMGAVFPGMISVEWKEPKLRAAGAFALFVIIYLLNPPKL